MRAFNVKSYVDRTLYHKEFLEFQCSLRCRQKVTKHSNAKKHSAVGNCIVTSKVMVVKDLKCVHRVFM